MKPRRRTVWLALAVLLLGVPGALLAVPLARMAGRLVAWLTPSDYAFAAANCAGFVVPSYLWAFLLTVLIPKAPNWSLAASQVDRSGYASGAVAGRRAQAVGAGTGGVRGLADMSARLL